MKVALHVAGLSGLLCLACDSHAPRQVAMPGPAAIRAIDAGQFDAGQLDAGNASPTAASSGSGTGAAGSAGLGGPMPPHTAPAPRASPAFPACVQCAPGCQDCGQGCTCARPPQPWTTPFKPQGPDGFRDSDEVLCPTSGSPLAFDVWSDVRGVFAVISGRTDVPLDADPTASGGDEDGGVVAYPQASSGGQSSFDIGALTQLWFNDGTGWTLSLTAWNDMARYGLRGAPGGWLAMHDRGVPPSAQFNGEPVTSCSLGMLANGALDCFDLGPVADLASVNSRLAHAIVDGNRIISYDGDRWRGALELLPFSANALWADANDVVAAGRLGTVMWLDQGSWTVQDPGSIEHFTRLWGTSRSDLWGGTAQGGIFHYDGTTWTEVGHLSGETCDNKSPITGIWGAGGQVYFSTDSQLARWSGNGIESIGNWACSPFFGVVQITGVWGNGPSELFIAMIDSSRSGMDRCAPVFIVYYDGTSYHRI